MGITNAASVAAEVRAALARRQITQTALAAATNRSQAYWSRRLGGATALSVDDLAAISDLTAVPIAVLVGEAAA